MDDLHATPEETARYLAWVDNQVAIVAKRRVIGASLAGDPDAAQTVRDAWAPLLPDGRELGAPGAGVRDADRE